ncbi:cupin domain-containing protein [Candidatus Saccharibacteria bacterium]|nr:cupin domain-containing protein [Candidatus Saccharibacteria bacterium]
MENKFIDLIELCKNNITLTDENVGEGRALVDRGTFQLVIPLDNTEDHGIFFVNSIKGHDSYSYNSESTHIYHIIDGTGEFIIDDEVTEVKPGDTVTIEPNKTFTYKGNMIIVFEMIPNFKEENDHFVKKVDY